MPIMVSVTVLELAMVEVKAITVPSSFASHIIDGFGEKPA